MTTVRDFARTDLYHHFYQPLGIKYQLGVAVAEDGGGTVGYAFSRGSPDFDEQAADLMAAAGRALAAAHHRVTARARLSRFESASRALLEDDQARGGCLVVIDERGRVEIAAGRLLPQVAAIRPDRAGCARPSRPGQAGHRLPRLVPGTGAARSRGQYRRDPGPGPGRRRVGAVPVARPRRPAGPVRPDRREYQTLANIARLETNERAAQAEGVSVPTIEKRISSVIRKMHVETRVGAVRKYLRPTSQ